MKHVPSGDPEPDGTMIGGVADCRTPSLYFALTERNGLGGIKHTMDQQAIEQGIRDLIERVRQAAYDDGYEDGLTDRVGSEPVASLGGAAQ